MAACNAARASGEVRRDGVSARPTRSSRIMSASCAPNARATAASRRNRPLLPPTSTAASGRGRWARRGAHSAAAAASRAGVAGCSAVRVTTTLGPVRPSWRLTTTTSKRAGSMRGCWICTTGRPGRRNAAPTTPAVPPAVNSTASPRSGTCTARNGRGQVRAAIQRQGARGCRSTTRGWNPAASAKPRAWACRPARGSDRMADARMRGLSALPQDWSTSPAHRRPSLLRTLDDIAPAPS